MNENEATLNELTKYAVEDYQSINTTSTPSNADRAAFSIAASNLVILELLKQLLWSKHESMPPFAPPVMTHCKCGDKPIPQYTQHSVPELIIQTLDLAAKLIKGGCEGREDGFAYNNQHDINLFGQLSQEIKNILGEIK